MPRVPTTCRSCGAAVVWLLTAAGKWMITDAASVPAGTRTYHPAAGHQAHWGSCPDAKAWRRGRTGGRTDDGEG
jgi:hypothetical protein